MASIIRTIQRALARQALVPREASVKPKAAAPKRQQRKGARSADTYRSAGRRSAIVAAKQQRRADRVFAVANRKPVDLPRSDGKCRDQENARRRRQMNEAA